MQTNLSFVVNFNFIIGILVHLPKKTLILPQSKAMNCPEGEGGIRILNFGE